MNFRYPCPDCLTTNNLHDPNCDYKDKDWIEIESTYMDILAYLTEGTYPQSELRENIDDWSGFHVAALGVLKSQRRVEIQGTAENENAELKLLSVDEYQEEVSKPTYEPMRTIYEKGSVNGCHDNAVFAMVAYYEMVGLPWEETKEKTIQWLKESGAWNRDGIDESTPEDLVKKKKHVYESGYGWKEKGKAAKKVIDRAL